MTATRFLLSAVATAFAAAAGPADERADAAVKQKAAAEANLKAAKIKAAVAETDNLLVFATLPDEKVKALAAAMEKTYTAAAKALKFDPASPPWPGKLTVVAFTEPRQYKAFVLDALKRPPLPRESRSLELRGDTPLAVDGVGLGEKPTDAQVTAELCGLVGAALVSRKAGVGSTTTPFGLPDWLQTGFGQAVTLRADGAASKLAAHKAKVRSLYAKTQGAAFKLASVWDGGTSAEASLLATSFTEYLAFGPYADKFPAFLDAFKPGETGDAPAIDAVLTAMEWKSPALEAGWRRWVATGK